MKLKNTLLLLAAAAAAFAFIWFFERHQVSSRDSAQDGNRLAKVDRDKVKAISIRSNDARIELRKDDKGIWQVTEPVKDRADSLAVAGLFTELEMLRHVERLDFDGKGASKDQLKDFGLSDPATRIKFTGDEKPFEILFGKDAAIEGRIYVKIDGSNVVYVTTNALKNQAAKRSDDFRDRTLTDLLVAQATKAVLKTPGGEIEVAKNPENRWMLTKPLNARGDDSKITDLISLATKAHIDAFVADSANLSAYGLQEPRAVFSIHIEGSENPTTLALGTHPKDEKEKEGIYGKLSSREAVVLLPKTLEQIVGTKPNDLRERALVRVESDIVDRITIHSADRGKIVLARSGEKWVRKDGDRDVKIDVGAAIRLLQDITGHQVADFVADVATDLPKYGLDQPRIKVTLSSYASQNTAETTAGEKPIVTVLFGRSEGGRTFAKLDDEPFIVSVLDDLPNTILTDPLEWQAPEIFSSKVEEVTSFEVARAGAPVISVTRDKDKGWKLAKGDASVNQVNANSLINTLATLRAMRWVGATVPEHGLATPSLTVSFTTSTGSTGKVTVGRATEFEQWHAAVVGRDGTFLLSSPDKSAFELPLIDKPAAPVGTAPAAADPEKPGASANSPAPAPTVPEPVKAAPKEAPAPTEAPTQPVNPRP